MKSAGVSNGFAIISAIFLLVVLAMLGAFAINISNTQHVGSALDVQSSRVYQAARAGVEWGLHQVMRSSSCVASTNLTFPAGATTLSGITATVTCASSGSPSVARIVATACNEPSGGACPNTVNPSTFYIERRVEVFVCNDATVCPQ